LSIPVSLIISFRVSSSISATRNFRQVIYLALKQRKSQFQGGQKEYEKKSMFLRLQDSSKEVERPKQAEKGLKSGMSEHNTKIKWKKHSYIQESAAACGRLLELHETEKGAMK
jgi:hypothetical protein